MSEDTLVADFTRQREMFDPEKHEHARVIVAGCGGIGSATAVALTKLGIPNLHLIDPDVIELHNIPNQMFFARADGHSKTHALAEVCEQFSRSTEIVTSEMLLEEIPRNILKGVLITGFDSMEARATAWKNAKFNANVERLIDARIGKEDIVVYSINPCDTDDIEYYETTLYSDEEAEELACTERAIIDVMFTVASLITRQVRRHFVGDNVERVTIFDQNRLEVILG